MWGIKLLPWPLLWLLCMIKCWIILNWLRPFKNLVNSVLFTVNNYSLKKSSEALFRIYLNVKLKFPSKKCICILGKKILLRTSIHCTSNTSPWSFSAWYSSLLDITINSISLLTNTVSTQKLYYRLLNVYSSHQNPKGKKK